MSGDRSRGIRRCALGSSAMRPARRRKRDRQSLPASAARKGTSHSSSRLERSLGIQLVIAPVPLKAPAAAYNGARPHHTTYRATWDNGISLITGDLAFYGNRNPSNGLSPLLQTEVREANRSVNIH